MNKEQIFNELNKLELDKEKYVVISGASLVVQGIIEETSDIDLSVTDEYYKQINWPEKIGNLNKPIKYKGNIEVGGLLFEEEAPCVIINGYKFINLYDILKVKKFMNREKDFKVIKKLEKILNV